MLDCSRDCRRAGCGCGVDARANRRGYPPRNPLPAKNTSADPIIVPGLYRRGGALSWRHHASGRCATQSTHRGHQHPARPGLGQAHLAAHGRGRQGHPSNNQEHCRTAAIRIDAGVRHSTAGDTPDEAALGVAGMRHDGPPIVWKPRPTIAFLTETAFQGLPLQLLMPRRSSSAARSD